MSVTASDPDGLSRVKVFFVDGGSALTLCGGTTPACSGTSGAFSSADVDPANYGASAGSVTLRLFVEDTLGNNVEVHSHTFTWDPPNPGPGYTLTVLKQGDGDGIVSGEGISCGPGCTSTSVAYNDGDTLTLTGTGDQFIGFMGDRCYGLAPCAITMYSDLTVTASFALPDSFAAEYTYPTSGNTGVSTTTQPAVTFNRDIAAGPNFNSLAFRECDGTALGFTPVLGSGTHDERLTFVLDSSMAKGTCHVAEVPAGSISDLDGNPLPAPVSFTFTTEEDGTPKMYVSAYPTFVMEGRETKVSIWFETPVDYNRTLTLSSSPSGALFHPSSVILPAGEVLYELQVDTDLNHGSLSDVNATLQVHQTDAGTISTNIIIVNDTAQAGAYLRWQAAAVVDDDNGNGIFEANERADIRFDVVNLGSQGISNVILEFEVANTYNMRILGGSPYICYLGYLDVGRNGNCTKTFLADDDLPTGAYYINVHGTGTIGSTTDHMYDNARITVVNNDLPDFTLNAGSFTSSALQPGSQQTVRYTANNIRDGFDLRLPQFEVFIDINGQEHLLHRTYADVRGDLSHSQTFDLPFTVPEVPGSHTIRARINPTGVIPEADSGNNEAAEITLNVAEPNQPPDLPSTIGPLTVNVGDSLAFTVTATDPNNDPLTYSLGPGAPSGLTIHPSTGLLSWTPSCGTAPQIYNVTVNVADPDGETDSGTVVIDVRRQADLSLSKTSTFTSALPGQTVDFTVEVRNDGPSCITGATVSDVFTADLTEVSWSCTASAGSSCTAGPVSGNIADNAVDLLSGGVATYTVSAKVTHTYTASGLVSNQASVTAPAGVSDPNAANNSGSTSISLRSLDFGDAGDSSLNPGWSFPTRLADDGARHGVDPFLVLGVAIDGESDGQPSEGAVGDDIAGADDESGVVFLTPMATCETADLEVTASAAGLLDAWVDFNGDGDWGDAGEQVFASRSLVAGVNALSFVVPCSAVPSERAFLRFRLSSTGGLSYAGLALDGEVEDYALPILGFDFGDAPAGYPTLRAENGPRHLLSLGSPVLGQRVDAEAGGIPEASAAGDDLDGPLDDEDGIAFTGLLVSGNLASLTVTVSAPARLDAWIDFNGDGDWADTGEQIFVNEAVPAAGANALSFAVPATAPSGLSTFGRFRLSSAGSLSVTGTASDGEVEDHPVTITATADLTLTLSDSADPAVAGAELSYTVMVTNQGPFDAPDVVVTDTLPAGVTFIATSGCAEDPNAIPSCRLGTIAAGTSRQYTFTVKPDPASSGAILNTACVTSSLPDANPGDECATEGTAVEAATDLSLVKDDSPDPLAPGSPLIYTLTVTNLGPSDSTGGQVTDVLPAALSFASSGDGCSEAGGTVTCAFGALAADGSISLSFVVVVDPSVVGLITNTATVTGDESDPVPDNNSDSESTQVNNSPPTLDPVGGPFTVNSGELLSFTATASDPNGDGLAFSLLNAPAGASIDPLTGVFTWTPTDAQGAQTYSLDVVVTDDDPSDPQSDSETIQIHVTRSVDLAVSKSVDPVAAAPGQSVVFTVTVTNQGPGGVSGATLSDPVVVGLNGVSWTCSAVGGSCTASGTGALVDGDLDLDHDGVATYTMQATLAPDAPPTVTNVASVSLPSEIDDPNPGNDQASASVSRRDLDFGDAPDASTGVEWSFPTRLSDDGARHGVDPVLVLGVDIDGEDDGQPSAGAVGDDDAGADDEDGVVFLEPMVSCEETDLEVTTSASGLLDAWVDFNGDGDWGDAGEQVFASRSLVAGVNALSFVVPCSAVPAERTFLRFRLSSTGGLSYTGLALDGEVEDYVQPILGYDYGDAPAGYPTLFAADGARHLLTLGGPVLGQRADAEVDGIPDPSAAGDDLTGVPDDEDGIASASLLVPGASASLTVTVSAPAKLDAWIDFNGDGDWTDPGEQIFVNEPVPSAGANLLTFAVPAGAVGGLSTVGRFRLSSAGGLPFTGAAPDGEVEDHVVVIDNGLACNVLTQTQTGNGTQPTASPSAARCPAGQYREGEQIQLEASPAPGWTIGSWTGTDNDASTSTSNTATMPEGPHEVMVHYVESGPTCFELVRTQTGNGTQPSASPSTAGCPAGQYAEGEQILLEAIPDSGWTVSRWTGTDNDASALTSNTATMPEGLHEVTVHYVPLTSVVLINEVFGGSPDYVELYNAGSSTVDLAGWVLETTGCGSSTVSQYVLPAFTLAPGAYVHVLENSGTGTSDTLYLNANICWNPDQAGSAALVDTVAGVDFVRWGGSTTPPPSGTSWTGDSAVAATGASVLGRDSSGRDTNAPTDWCEQVSSAPGVNVGCTGFIFSDGFESGDRSAWTTSVP